MLSGESAPDAGNPHVRFDEGRGLFVEPWEATATLLVKKAVRDYRLALAASQA